MCVSLRGVGPGAQVCRCAVVQLAWLMCGVVVVYFFAYSYPLRFSSPLWAAVWARCRVALLYFCETSLPPSCCTVAMGLSVRVVMHG